MIPCPVKGCRQRLTVNDAAWAAGLMDGDGSIGFAKIYHKERKGKKGPWIVAWAQCACTEKELPSRLKEIFGGYVGKRSRVKSSHEKKEMYRWEIKCKLAVYAVAAMLPFLVSESKKRRALSILTHYRNKHLWSNRGW